MLPQHDEKLPEHGCVHVTYYNTLLDPPPGEPEMKPYTYNEKGDKITAPKGLLYMKEGAAVDLTIPASIEPWKHADVSDAEGLDKKDVWQKKKARLQ